MSFIKKVYRRIRDVFESKILSQFFRLIPIKKDTVLFESVPDLSDNTKAVFDEMIRLGLNKDYKMIWLVKGEADKYPEIDNVSYFTLNKKCFSDRIRVIKIKMTAGILICCNDFLVSERKKQISFYLTHGTPIKYVKSYYTMPKKVNYCLAASEELSDIVSDQFNTTSEKVFACGFPRNDILCSANRNLQDLFEKEFKKTIVWYPTFRQHRTGATQMTTNALPIIHNIEQAERINDFAKENGVLIIVKPHFAQDLKYIKSLNLSNIVFIYDDFFVNNNISSYEFVGSCDALITDYSSIYFDYHLCNKPIALVWEDYENYKEEVGFAIDMDHYMKGSEKIYTSDDFCRFITHVACDNDLFKTEREEIKHETNYKGDDKSSERVVSFILAKTQNKQRG